MGREGFENPLKMTSNNKLVGMTSEPTVEVIRTSQWVNKRRLFADQYQRYNMVAVRLNYLYICRLYVVSCTLLSVILPFVDGLVLWVNTFPCSSLLSFFNACTCCLLFGGGMFTMANTFLFVVRIPFWVTRKPRYSILTCLNNDLFILHLIPLS